ncbi:MAG TPA: ATP-binding protein [Blastocatellia bacterium]|nr:ATP-binding protein [Blastocatellia bacterium]
MRRKLHWLVLWRLVIVALLLAVVAIIERGAATPAFTPAMMTVAVLALVLSAIYLACSRLPIGLSVQAYLHLSIDLLIVTWLVHQTGDIESPFPALYLVIIFAASSILSRKAVFSLATVGGILYAVNGVLKVTGLLGRAEGWAPYDGDKAASSEFMLALNVMAIFAVAALASHLAERLHRSEKDLAIATRDLADYRVFNDRIIESIRSGLITTDLVGSIITFNRAAEEITGHKLQDIRGKSLFTIFGDIERQIEVGLESIRTRTRLPRFDIGCRTADGREIHLGFSVAPLLYESRPIGGVTTQGYVFTFQDLTEVMELEREVRRQERLAALGKMAAGLAHEIRNPLASMRGSVQVLAGELDLSRDQSQLMEIVLRESDRLNRIVSDFLIYARPPRSEPQIVDLSSILSETLALLRHSPELSPKHEVVDGYNAQPVLYNGDPNQLRQVFWNLARNAIQAMPLGGELKVILDAKPEQDVVIVFSDTGEGMSNEQKERIFEPFNSSSGGTGLGMAIVYQLVRDHNGKIVVDSEAGKGTQISIKLPASQRVSGSVPYTAAAGSIAAPPPAKEVESSVA